MIYLICQKFASKIIISAPAAIQLGWPRDRRLLCSLCKPLAHPTGPGTPATGSLARPFQVHVWVIDRVEAKAKAEAEAEAEAEALCLRLCWPKSRPIETRPLSLSRLTGRTVGSQDAHTLTRTHTRALRHKRGAEYEFGRTKANDDGGGEIVGRRLEEILIIIIIIIVVLVLFVVILIFVGEIKGTRAHNGPPPRPVAAQLM